MSDNAKNDPFQSWDTASAVRSKDRRRISDGYPEDAVFFNPSLVPVMSHPAVLERGADFVRSVQIFHLFRYLEYTDFIELEIVNRSVHPIMRHRLPWDFSDPMVLGAYKLYVDEGYHAEMSVNMRAQIRAMIELPAQRQTFPRGLRRVVDLIHAAPADQIDLMYLMASTVSETLISNNLKQACDPLVVAPVRRLIYDHFLDETVHHHYFSLLFSQIWPCLSSMQKDLVGRHLPLFIEAFLMGDPSVTQEDLVTLGVSPGQAEEIVAESYGDNALNPEVTRKAAEATLLLFRRNGLYALEGVADAFLDKQLIDRPQCGEDIAHMESVA